MEYMYFFLMFVSIFFDLHLPPSVPSILFRLSNDQVFFFFLLLSLPSSVFQWYHEEGNFFSELAFLRRILFRSVLFSAIHSRTCSLVTFSGHFIFSIVLHYYIPKLSKYFRSNFLSVQVSGPYKAMLQIYYLTNLFLSSMFSLLVKGDIDIVYFAMFLAGMPW